MTNSTNVVVPPPPPPAIKATPEKKKKPRKPRGPITPAGVPVLPNFTTYVIVPAESKYQPQYCKLLIDHSKKGYSYESFSAEISVSRRVLYKWESVFPEWAEAKEIAYEQRLKYWEQQGRLGVAGKIKGFNAVAYIYTTKNRLKRDFKNDPREETPEPPRNDTPISEQTDSPIEASKIYLKWIKG